MQNYLTFLSKTNRATHNRLNTMADGPSTRRNRTSVELELYFLIERFLATGPCRSAAKVLRRELEEHELLPKRTDWEGGEHERSFDSLLELNRHIGGCHLLKICQRLGPLLDEKVQPHILGVKSLLGAGSQSLLRTEEDMRKLDWTPDAHIVLNHGRSLLPPINLVQPNRLFVHRGYEMSGQAHFNHLMSISMYDNIRLHSRKLGHLSAVYCVLFDRTGAYIFTGADDLLVKIWQVSDARLKATLRGHSAEITDMAVNHENTHLASGSCDKTIRVWCLKTKAPVAILQGHTGMVTSLQFSPMVKPKGNVHYLASTGGDACVCFWEWNTTNKKFNTKPMKFIERSRAGAQITCACFSPGGMFYAAGSTDNVIRMYQFLSGYPEKIGELEKHVDRVDSICYANNDNRFLSGSRDNSARIWRFERSEWRSIELKVNTLLKKNKQGAGIGDGNDQFTEDSSQPKLKVTMVAWSNDDSLVVTAASDYSLKVWCSYNGSLKHILRGHEDEVYVLEASPLDSRIMLSAGHDGKINIWDIIKGVKVKGFFNLIEGQGHGAVFDCKFSPDGTSFAATDSHGHVLIHGLGSNEKHKKIPDAVFFHTDYRPLIRDSNNYVLDEQTQQAPHLMPPPFLVDIDGNPYPAALQRLVPGRENLKDDQLVPELAVNEEGEQEVMGDREPVPVENAEPTAGPSAEAPSLFIGSPPHPGSSVTSPTMPGPSTESHNRSGPSGEVRVEHRPSIDHMIEELARRQDEQMAARGQIPIGSPPQLGSPRAVQRSNSVAGAGSSHMVGMRRVGETEGVRQSLGNIQQVATSKDIAALSRRVVVGGLSPAVLKKNEKLRAAMAEAEVNQYNLERKKKNVVVRRDCGDERLDNGILTRKKNTIKRGSYTSRGAESEDMATNRLTQRALYDTDEESYYAKLEQDGGSDMWNEDDSTIENDGDSSDYSDWGMGTGSNLQPPKRTSKRVRKRKRYTTTEESDEVEEVQDSRESRESSQSSQVREPRGKAPKKKEKDKPPIKKKRTVKKKQTASDAAQLPGKTPQEQQVILTRYRPPDWLTDVLPRKQPYFPQMGDELVYFRQGHELYVKAVERRKAYSIDINKGQPWHKYHSLREQELVRIVGVRYEMLKCGVRLCCLKLSYIDPGTLKNTGGSFRIKYHDMPDVVDFLVLKQNYDIAMGRKWKPGDRFRSVIDDSWWMGIIEDQVPFQDEYPDSMFQCFKVRWDNAEREFLSPWDMEPVDEQRKQFISKDSMHATIKEFVELCIALFNHTDKLKKRKRAPSKIGGGIMVTPDELKSLMYKPKPSEWPGKNRDSECDRIVRGWEQVMEHSIAEPFLTPVDLNVFPSYAMSIEYPMDLNTIKRRLENRFYRRVTALQFDVRYIESNAKRYNEPRSQIVRSAQVLCDSLLNLISDQSCTDPYQLISKLSEGRKIHWSSSSDSGEETEDYDATGGKKKKMEEKSASVSQPRKKRKFSLASLDPDRWKTECHQLLETIFQCEDSVPFRVPVDIQEYPNYYEVIEQPMDLGNIRANMEGGMYKEPTEFAKDMKLIFSNSRGYNTNKRSKIYSMTLRLSAMFESRMKEVVLNWKRAIRHRNKRFPNYLLPKSQRVYSDDTPGMSGATSSRPFASVGRASSSGLTNGKSQHVVDEDTDVDITTYSPAKRKYTRKRPQRERRTTQRVTGYNYSDVENHEFPDPKPDYTDDDFEVEPKKSSPKKKEIPRKSAVNGVASNGNSSTRYSTRVATGSLKTRKYTNDGFLTDEYDDEAASKLVIEYSESDSKSHPPIVKRQSRKTRTIENDDEIDFPKMAKRQSRKMEPESDSDTEIDTPKPVKRKSFRGCKPTRRKATIEQNPRSSKRKRTCSNTDSEATEVEEPESENDANNSSKSDTENRSFDSSGSDTEPNSPVIRVHTSQESHRYISARHKYDSDSGKRKNSSYASHSKGGKHSGRRTRNQGKQTVKYNEESDNSDNSENRSVSSKGRVRKLTARAKYNEESDNSDNSENRFVSSRGRVRKPTAQAKYNEESDNSDNSENRTVSSRGRIRKLTARARALWD